MIKVKVTIENIAKIKKAASDRMFFICKERCMCTAPVASNSGAQADPTVLYCFGEVNLNNLPGEFLTIESSNLIKLF